MKFLKWMARLLGWLTIGVLAAWVVWTVRTGEPAPVVLERVMATDPGWTAVQFLRLEQYVPQAMPERRAEARLTAEERAVLQRLQEAARAEAPTHRLELVEGRVLTGRVMEERPDAVVFVERWGDSGEITATIRRERVAALEALEIPDPDISYRDVRFQMEFPDLKLYRRAPYTVLTDESWFRVQDTVDLLRLLHERFLEVWGPLLHTTRPERHIQVLFFSDQARFREAQAGHVLQLDNPQGFYSPAKGRLVLFNQRASERVLELRAQLEAEENRHRAEGAGPELMARVREWRLEQDRNLDRHAEEQTRATIRHEGAHQLFDAYQLYSPNRIENDWLIEGLAMYCEGPYPGADNPSRSEVLRAALEEGTLIPLKELVGARRFSDLPGVDSVDRIVLAYAQAWGLVQYLMRSEHRALFFDYLRHLREHGDRADVRAAEPLAVLCRFLVLEEDELWRRWVEWARL